MSANRKEMGETPHRRTGMMTSEFDQIDSPGVYIENRRGVLLRIPPDALIPGRSPAIEVLSDEPWLVTKISEDPYLPLTKARMIAADMDLRIHF